MSVFFENELDTEIPAHYQDIVEDIIEASLDFLKCPYECEVNVIFTDHAGIQAINKEYRDIDSLVSFQMRRTLLTQAFNLLLGSSGRAEFINR